MRKSEGLDSLCDISLALQLKVGLRFKRNLLLWRQGLTQHVHIYTPTESIVHNIKTSIFDCVNELKALQNIGNAYSSQERYIACTYDRGYQLRQAIDWKIEREIRKRKNIYRIEKNSSPITLVIFSLTTTITPLHLLSKYSHTRSYLFFCGTQAPRPLLVIRTHNVLGRCLECGAGQRLDCLERVSTI